MKITHTKTVLSIALASCFSLAHSAEQPFSVSANVALASDYVVRGITQTDEGPAIQGGFDFNHDSGFYIGTWGSNVKFLEGADVKPEDRADIEVDAYFGYANELNNGLSYDLGWIYYAYPGAGGDLNYDYYEYTLGFGHSMNGVDLGLNYMYSPENFGETGKAHNVELSAGYTLDNGIGFGGYVGRQYFKDNEKAGEDFTHYGLFVSYALAGFDLSLNFHDTNLDEDEFKDIADKRVVFSISKEF